MRTIKSTEKAVQICLKEFQVLQDIKSSVIKIQVNLDLAHSLQSQVIRCDVTLRSVQQNIFACMQSAQIL